MAPSADIPIPSIEGGFEGLAVASSPSSDSSSSPNQRVLTPSSTFGSDYDEGPTATVRAESSTIDTTLREGMSGIDLSSSAQGRETSRVSLTPGLYQSGDQGRGSRSGSRVTASPPHDVGSEEPLYNVAQMRKVQGAVADAKALMGRMETILCRSDIAGDEASTLNRLKREAARLAEFAIPESRTVGLVGDSGVGK